MRRHHLDKLHDILKVDIGKSEEERSKMVRYTADVLPLAVETYGRWGKRAVAWWRVLARHVVERDPSLAHHGKFACSVLTALCILPCVLYSPLPCLIPFQLYCVQTRLKHLDYARLQILYNV